MSKDIDMEKVKEEALEYIPKEVYLPAFLQKLASNGIVLEKEEDIQNALILASELAIAELQDVQSRTPSNMLTKAASLSDDPVTSAIISDVAKKAVEDPLTKTAALVYAQAVAEMVQQEE